MLIPSSLKGYLQFLEDDYFINASNSKNSDIFEVSFELYDCVELTFIGRSDIPQNVKKSFNFKINSTIGEYFFRGVQVKYPVKEVNGDITLYLEVELINEIKFN